MLAIHPLAELFPPMSDAEYAALRDDVRAHGVLQPVVLWRGQVVDGRHRVRAASECGVTPPTTEMECEESDLPARMVSFNLHRRHLNESQRAVIAAKMANMRAGGDRRSDGFKSSADDLKQPKIISQEQAAEVMGASKAYVEKAARIMRESPPEVVKAIEEGKVTVNKVVTDLRAQGPKPRKPKGDGKVVSIASAPMRQYAGKPANEVRDNAVRMAGQVAIALEQVWEKPLPDDATLRQWMESLDETIATLRRFRRRIEEGENGQVARA